MNHNPYKYLGPLDPIADQLVCIPRVDKVNKVIEGLTNRGEFYAVLGPNQIGKTTFLRQIEKGTPMATHVYLDFQVTTNNEEAFYRWLRDQFIAKIPHEAYEDKWDQWSDWGPDFKFFNFLNTFQPKSELKNIILLFDEIEQIPSVKGFLQVWRKVFHERYREKRMGIYSVILTGRSDLLKLTNGPNSPFNIAEVYYMKDFSDEESDFLIEHPFRELGLNIDPVAKSRIIKDVGGHPHLLQQACHILVELAREKKRTIILPDVDRVVDEILQINQLLGSLKLVMKDKKFRQLIIKIMDKEKKKYFPYKEFSLIGAGAIIERDGYCAVRNPIYEKFLKGLLDNIGEETWENLTLDHHH